MKRTIPSALIVALCLLQACSWVHAKSIGDADPTPSPHFECPDEDDYYPNPTNCKAFYQCVNGTAWQQECPADLYFNPILKVCDYKENVDCKQDTIKTIRDVEPTPSPTFKCPEEQGFYSNPTDCSKFYLCANYLAWEQQCPGKLLFNKAINQCDFPEKVDCNQKFVRQSVKIPKADPTPSPKFQCPEDEGLFPSPTDCKKFYQCFNHTAWQSLCPADLYFNPILKVCDFKENVDCTL